MAFSGMFTPVLAKHSKSFPLIDCISVGVDRTQRNFEPLRKQVEAWQRSDLNRRHGEGGDLRGFRRRKTRSSQTPRPQRTLPLLRAKVRGIPAANDLEPLQCTYIRTQGTGSYRTVQGGY